MLFAFAVLFSIIALAVPDSDVNATCSRGTINETNVARDEIMFGVALYSELVKDDPSANLVFSPISISLLMSMILEGTEEEDAAERQILETVFPESGDRENFIASFGSMHRPKTSNERRVNISSANGIFVDQTVSLGKEFERSVRKCWHAEVRALDFEEKSEAARQHINNWVKSRTNGTIKELLEPGDVSTATTMMLVSAIRFKANWVQKFDRNETKQISFHGGINGDHEQDVDMMELHHVKLLHSTYPTFDILGIPHEGGRMVMYFLLPKATDGLKDLERELELLTVTEQLQILNAAQEKIMTSVQIPKFKETSSLDQLREKLIRLGIRDIFLNDTNFCRISNKPGFSVSDVIHKAFVEIDEDGTEAVDTNATLTDGIISKPELVFSADHPFIYVIQHRESGSIVFLGRFVTPTEL